MAERDCKKPISRSQKKSKTWAVIPVYNNAATIRRVALECRTYLEHVLVVDDGSTDADLRLLLDELDVAVVRHERNQGKGVALQTAFDYVNQAGGEFAVTLDGDGQHFPSDIPAFIDELDQDTILIGVRQPAFGEMPARSRFGRRFSDFWVWIETGHPLRDTQSGFRAYPVGHILQLPWQCSRYDYEIEILARAAWAGLRFKTVPVKVSYNPAEGRVSSFRPFFDNLRISLTHTRLIGRRLVPLPARHLVQRELTLSELSRHPGKVLCRLLKENATPRGLAVSAWCGVFLGALPLIGLHMLAVLYVTARLHMNKAMALSIQNVCMPPVVPGVCIAVGYFMRHGRLITEASLTELGRAPLERLWEWALGSLVVAPLLATLFAVLIYGGAIWLQSGTSCKITQSE